MFKNKNILVTGSCGTVGTELIRQLLSDSKNQPGRVVGLDSNESQLFFQDELYKHDDRSWFFLGDIRDKDTLNHLMKGIDIVFHAAALKHVILCERSPMDAVRTNIQGLENLIQAAIDNDVEKVIFTSTDKAVNPTNVMGTSKLMGERLITAANSKCRNGRTILASTRFGNILGSNGSVYHIFREQIQKGAPLTLTDRSMTRFVMTIEESASLVLSSVNFSKGGEVFITKMPVVRISDLAEVMVETLAPKFGFNPKDIEIKEIGAKPGEKFYEELMSEEEVRRAMELDHFFVVKPAFKGYYDHLPYEYPNLVKKTVDRPYNSQHERAISKEEIKKLMMKSGLLSL